MGLKIKLKVIGSDKVWFIICTFLQFRMFWSLPGRKGTYFKKYIFSCFYHLLKLYFAWMSTDDKSSLRCSEMHFVWLHCFLIFELLVKSVWHSLAKLLSILRLSWVFPLVCVSRIVWNQQQGGNCAEPDIISYFLFLLNFENIAHFREGFRGEQIQVRII